MMAQYSAVGIESNMVPSSSFSPTYARPDTSQGYILEMFCCFLFVPTWEDEHAHDDYQHEQAELLVAVLQRHAQGLHQSEVSILVSDQ